MPTGAVRVRNARSRKLEVAGAMQPQQQAATNGVLEHAVGLSPVPNAADFLRDPPPVHRRILGDQLPQKGQIGVRDFPTAIGENDVHGRPP